MAIVLQLMAPLWCSHVPLAPLPLQWGLGAAQGQIRFGELFRGDSELVLSSFKHRALHSYNAVPHSVRTGSLPTVKHKLRNWVKQNVQIDWG